MYQKKSSALNMKVVACRLVETVMLLIIVIINKMRCTYMKSKWCRSVGVA